MYAFVSYQTSACETQPLYYDVLTHVRMQPENTHLLCKGKYHCTADLLFDWFGFSCFVEFKL